jgi:hypothetical protein
MMKWVLQLALDIVMRFRLTESGLRVDEASFDLLLIC